MTRRPTPAVLQAIRAQRARSDRILNSASMHPAQRVFAAQQTALVQRLARAEKGRTRDDADMRIVRRFYKSVALQVADATTRIGNELAGTSRETLEGSFRSLAQFMRRAQGSAGPLDDRDVVSALVTKRLEHIEELRRQSMRELGQRLEDKISQRVIVLAASGRHDIGEVIDAVGEEMEAQRWQIDRLARTESSYAFNVAQAEGVRAIAKHFPGVMQRWTELVDDTTGKPLDARVAADSLAMHGQVARPGGSFLMPTAGGSLAGQSWMHPPNRPNDRAVLTPWMRDWGVPAWQFRNGRRVNLR